LMLNANWARTMPARLKLLVLSLLLLAAPPAWSASPAAFGINVHAPQGDGLEVQLDRARAAGIGWVRIDFIWAVVEPARGKYDWRIYDAIAAAAKARGLQVFATLGGNPGAQVGGPDLAHLTAGNADWYDWLRQTLLEAGDRLDFITHHVYDTDGHRDVTGRLESKTVFGGKPSFWDAVAPSVKEVLRSTGWFGRKPFWLTQTGWGTGPGA